MSSANGAYEKSEVFKTDDYIFITPERSISPSTCMTEAILPKSNSISLIISDL